jgi:hypothetical protein
MHVFHAILCELASQHGTKCRAACPLNRLASEVALPERSRIVDVVEYRGFWRYLGEGPNASVNPYKTDTNQLLYCVTATINCYYHQAGPREL